MISVTFYAKEENGTFSLNFISGFRIEGHAGFDRYGKDIVCAAVSALVMNTMNSIQSFTQDRFQFDEDEKKGLIDFQILSPVSDDSRLLLRSLLLGVNGICEQYGEKYMHIEFRHHKEV